MDEGRLDAGMWDCRKCLKIGLSKKPETHNNNNSK